MFADFNFQQMISAFIVLFAVIDIIGSIPIIINLKEKGKDVNALKATVISFIRTDQGSHAGASGLPLAGRCRFVYNPAFIEGRVCQYQYCSRFDTEYAMGIFRGSYDTEGGKGFRKRRYLLDP